jgi:drug/metabolite transporter (DMT)-like permease
MLFILILILSILLVSASVSLKYYLIYHPIAFSLSIKLISFYIISFLKSPYIWLSIIFSLAGWIMWMYIINKYPLSQAYPMVSVAYILMMLVDYFFFDQPFTTSKIAGIVSISLGVWFLSR